MKQQANQANHQHREDASRAREILRVIAEGETFLTVDNIRQVASILFRYANSSKSYRVNSNIISLYKCGELTVILNVTNPHIVWGGNMVYSVESLNKLLAE